MRTRGARVGTLRGIVWSGWYGASIAVTVLIASSGCGTSLPLPLADDTGNDASTPPTFDFDGAPQPLSCNLGPNYGVCACLDLPLLTDVPNMYFVLDRSGSMSQGSKWDVLRSVVGTTVLALGPRINLGAAVFPSAAHGGCFAGDEVMSPRQGDAPAGVRGQTFFTFASAVDAVYPNGGTPTAATLRALLPKLKALSGRTYVVLATDGGPNCNAVGGCTVDQCIPNIENVSSTCKPNTAPNCCDVSLYGPGNCLDSDATVAAVQALRDADIPVYVIGVFGSGPYADVLDRAAQAGGTARDTKPFYYAVESTDSAPLASALAQIAAKIAGTCVLGLHGKVDPAHVNVFLDGAVVPQDPVNGWSIDGNTVTLLGATCDEVMSGKALEIRIVAGCPTVIR
jgi:hypothetical protein